MRWIDAPVWVKSGRFIKWARTFKGYSQQDVASRSGIDLKTLKRIEKGLERNVTIEQAYRIALALKCDVDEIIPNLAPKYMVRKYILG